MARTFLARSLAVLATLVSTTAWAGPRDDALAAIAAGDLKAAKKSLAILDDHLGMKKKLVRPEVISRRYLTEALYHETRGKPDDVLDALRQACLVSPGSDPDQAIIGDGSLVDMYYAVCKEVKQRPEVDLDSLKLPDAPVRIDGAVPGEAYAVREGRHLVQVKCRNGTWSTRWSELSRPENWGEACPGGKLAAAVEDQPEDLVEAVMPSFLMGGGDMDGGDMDGGPDGTEAEASAADGASSSDAAGASSSDAADASSSDAAGASSSEAADASSSEAAGASSSDAAGAATPPAQSTASAAGSAEKVRLVVKCAPSPCTVKVDGKVIGESPLITRVEVGERDFSLKAGPNSITRKLMLSADESTMTVSWDHEKGDWSLGTPGSMP